VGDDEPSGGASRGRSVAFPDARLVPVALAAWAIAWVAPLAGVPAAAGFAAVAFAAGVALLVRHWRAPRARSFWKPVVAAALVVAGATAGVSAARASTSTAGIVDDLARERAVASVTVRITSDAQRVDAPGPPVWLVRATVTEAAGRGRAEAAAAPIVVFTRDDAWLGLLPSTVVRVSGRLVPPDRLGREVAALAVVGSYEVVTPPTRLQRAAGRLRAGLRAAVSGLPADARGLVPGLVVGDDALVPADLDDAFRTAGLTHLLAVSGTNVAIVLGFALTAGRWVGVRGLALRVVALGAVAGFVVLARPEPSVVRAGVMGVVAVVGGSGRRRRPLSALVVAVVLLLLIDPWLARSYGFALSVVATAAIVVFSPRYRDQLARWMPRPLAEAIAVPLAAQLACAPIIVLLSSNVSMIAVLANVLAAPAVAPATITAVVVTVLAQVTPAVAATLAWLPGAAALWISAVARWCAGLPYATVPWAGGVRGATGLAIATVVVLVIVKHASRRSSIAAGTAAVLVVTYVAVRVVGPGWPPAGWDVVACDVGQGDAIVLSTGPGSAVVVDSGPEPDPVDRCLRRLGVEVVPLMVLTHSDADHVGGLEGILRGRDVGQIAVAPRSWVPEKLPQLRAFATAHEVALVEVSAGSTVDLGRLHVQTLWPPRDGPLPVDAGGSPQNGACVVVLAGWDDGLRALLTGDLPPAGQRALLASGVDLSADVLKVPHHGSRFQDGDFLAASGARLAIVSVGEDNTYGHPAPQTLDLLSADGMTVRRTDELGSIAITGAEVR
jgi:competence protein ComEC